MSKVYRNLREPQNVLSGVAEFALVAPKSFFTDDGIKSPVAPFTTPGDSIKIKDAHVFKEGKGFIYYQLAPQKNELSYKTVGDLGLSKLNAEAKIFIPGSYAELHEAMADLVNVPLIVLQKDSQCAANLYYHLGNDCQFAWVKPEFTTGTTASGVKGYAVTIVFDGGPLFYDVTGAPEILDNNASASS